MYYFKKNLIQGWSKLEKKHKDFKRGKQEQQ